MAAWDTPSPPREWPTSSTLDRSAGGTARTTAGADARPGPPDQAAQSARCRRTRAERAAAPPSARSPSWALMPLAAIDTVS